MRQVELAVNLAVNALTSLTTDGDNRSISLLQFVGHATLRDFYLVKLGLSLIEEPHHRVLVGLQLHLRILHVVLVYLCQQRRGLHTNILQTLHHIDNIRHVDTTRTQTTREEVIAIDAKQRHRLQIADGQYAIVFQQHHTLGR